MNPFFLPTRIDSLSTHSACRQFNSNLTELRYLRHQLTGWASWIISSIVCAIYVIISTCVHHKLYT